MSTEEDSGSDSALGCSPSSDHGFVHSSDLFRAVLTDTLKLPSRDLASQVKMSDEYDSDCNTPLGTSPSYETFAKDTGLYTNVLNDYLFDDHEMHVSKCELERYKSAKLKKGASNEHDSSRRCETCKNVITHCKCDLHDGKDRKHRVHWADEIWDAPLTTDGSYEEGNTVGTVHAAPKPILKHRATCVIIVSEKNGAYLPRETREAYQRHETPHELYRKHGGYTTYLT